MAETYILYVDKTDREIIEKLININFLNFKESKNTEIFLFAFSIGIRDNMKIPLESKDSYTRFEYFSRGEKALVYACALEGILDFNNLNDKSKLFEFVQESAHYGFRYLNDQMNQGNLDNFEKREIRNLNTIFEIHKEKKLL